MRPVIPCRATSLSGISTTRRKKLKVALACCNLAVLPLSRSRVLTTTARSTVLWMTSFLNIDALPGPSTRMGRRAPFNSDTAAGRSAGTTISGCQLFPLRPPASSISVFLPRRWKIMTSPVPNGTLLPRCDEPETATLMAWKLPASLVR